MIDWLNDFEANFGGHDFIKQLKTLKFHGKVEINFYDGKPLTANVNMNCKAGSQVNMTIMPIKHDI